MIEIKNVSKSYGTFNALNDVNLKIEEGSIVGLVGINGVYYLFAEFLSVLNIKNKASSYIRNTISELGMTTSPLYILMNSAFILTGILFFLAYIYLFKYNNKIKK